MPMSLYDYSESFSTVHRTNTGHIRPINTNYTTKIDNSCYWELHYFIREASYAHLDTSRSALGDSIGYGSSRRVNHTHEADKSQVIYGEVDIIGVELVSDGVLVGGQLQVAKAEHALAQAAQLEVRVVEGLLHFLIQHLEGRYFVIHRLRDGGRKQIIDFLNQCSNR